MSDSFDRNYLFPVLNYELKGSLTTPKHNLVESIGFEPTP
ncbi:hypothetical protein E27107_60087 [Elizabethkingia anophelis]|nr:hypothetical protein E27107_60087 [Elizabethkingia anophelis]